LYEVSLNSAGVTPEPITFNKGIVFVKGTEAPISFQTNGYIISTGNCNNFANPPVCDWTDLGGGGFPLAPCADVDGTQTCVSIAVQLFSDAGTNFNVTLADGEQFCTYAVNTSYLTVKPGGVAIDHQCIALGCKGVSAPINLRRAPHC
jgi:hypothetical protein